MNVYCTGNIPDTVHVVLTVHQTDGLRKIFVIVGVYLNEDKVHSSNNQQTNTDVFSKGHIGVLSL